MFKKIVTCHRAIGSLVISRYRCWVAYQAKKQQQWAANYEKAKESYFDIASSWADDLYVSVVASRNRYRAAFIVALALTGLLTLAVCLMVPLQKTELVIVHQTEQGPVWVEPGHQPVTPPKQAQLEADLVRYVTARESYQSFSFDQNYQLTNLLSSKREAKRYQKQQAGSNNNAFYHRLGETGERRVSIDNIVFLETESVDNKHKGTSKNLAQVTFRVIERNKEDSSTVNMPLVALIQWTYVGAPSSPDQRWQNWNGFMVTHYQLQPRNITSPSPGENE